eukprot:gene18135-5737_t
MTFFQNVPTKITFTNLDICFLSHIQLQQTVEWQKKKNGDQRVWSILSPTLQGIPRKDRGVKDGTRRALKHKWFSKATELRYTIFAPRRFRITTLCVLRRTSWGTSCQEYRPLPLVVYFKVRSVVTIDCEKGNERIAAIDGDDWETIISCDGTLPKRCLENDDLRYGPPLPMNTRQQHI